MNQNPPDVNRNPAEIRSAPEGGERSDLCVRSGWSDPMERIIRSRRVLGDGLVVLGRPRPADADGESSGYPKPSIDRATTGRTDD